MIFHGLYIDVTPTMGRGVFTSIDIEANTIIEISPVIVMTREERKLLDQTLLHDYIFEWIDKDHCCLALGYVSLYNHSYNSNCEYEMPARPDIYRESHSGGSFETASIKIRTI